MLEWAEKEINIAKKKELEDCEGTEAELDYVYACYDSALKAYKSLVEDGHTAISMFLTKSILNRLIDGKPLTYIEDTEDAWSADGQHKRMPSVFKKVNEDGTVKYKDIDRVLKIDIGSNTCGHNGIVNKYIDKLYPIKMPYMPNDKPYKVHCDDFCYLKPSAVGEYTHLVLLYLVKPDGTREEINKYYKETDKGMTEISENEWFNDYEETFNARYQTK